MQRRPRSLHDEISQRNRLGNYHSQAAEPRARYRIDIFKDDELDRPDLRIQRPLFGVNLFDEGINHAVNNPVGQGTPRFACDDNHPPAIAYAAAAAQKNEAQEELKFEQHIEEPQVCYGDDRERDGRAAVLDGAFNDSNATAEHEIRCANEAADSSSEEDEEGDQEIVEEVRGIDIQGIEQGREEMDLHQDEGDAGAGGMLPQEPELGAGLAAGEDVRDEN